MEVRNWNIIQTLKTGKAESVSAMLILNQPILCGPEIIVPLWRNAAFRILVDGGSNRWINFLETLKIQDLQLPDFISGDFDSITSKTRDYFERQNVKMISTPNQDETDFKKAFELTLKVFEEKHLNVELIIAVCENSGRFDQIMGNISTLHRLSKARQDITTVILSSQSVTWVLHPGKHIILVPKELVEKQYSCGLIPLCGPTLVTTSGLKWNLDGDILEMDGLVSTSNTYSATEVSVTCSLHLVWTAQYCKINE